LNKHFFRLVFNARSSRHIVSQARVAAINIRKCIPLHMGHKNPLPTILTFIPIRNPVENPVFDSRRGAIKMRHALGLLQCIALHNLRRAGVSRKVGIKYSFKMQHATLWHDALLYHHPSIRNHPPPTAHAFNCGRCKCKCHRTEATFACR